MPRYEKGVQWVKDILFRVSFEQENINVKATKLLNSIGDHKREGDVILNLMYNDVVFKNGKIFYITHSSQKETRKDRERWCHNLTIPNFSCKLL